MDKFKFWLCLTLAIFSSPHKSKAQIAQQQNNPFNQNVYRRVTPFNQQQQSFNQPQPFQRIGPLSQYSPLLPGQNTYNARYNSQNYVPITAYQNEINYDGSFAYGYSTGDGTTAQAQGYVKNLGVKDLEAQVIQGSYSYTAPDGSPIQVSYIADENGFRAEGAHIPTPPPIPNAIVKSLDYIQRNQIYNQNLNSNINTLNPNFNQNLNPFQTPQQFQQQQRQNQITSNALQTQQQILQQQTGQYAPNLQYQQPQQRQFQGSVPFPQNPLNNNQIQQQRFQQQQQQHQQQQQQQQQDQSDQQLLTQQLQGRSNQLLTAPPNQFDFNKFRRYKKETKKQQFIGKQVEKLQKSNITTKPTKRNSIKVILP